MNTTTPQTAPGPASEPTPEDQAQKQARPRPSLIEIAPTLMLVALVAGVSILEPSFLKPRSIQQLLGQFPLIFVLALGQMTVILMGRIDLSNAAVCSFGAILMAKWVPSIGPLGLLAPIIITTLIGAFQGWLHVKAQVASFMITLGGLGVWSGLALYISGQKGLAIDPGFTKILDDRTLGIPNVAIFALVVGAIYAFVLGRTTFGRRVYAVGNGQRAASLSGIQSERTIVAGFALSGFFSGLAALVMVSTLLIASSTTANALLLPAIAAVILGGNAITGGVGGVGRTLVGAMMIAVLRVGLDVAGVNPSWQPIVFGLLAVLSVAATIDRSRLLVIK